MSKSTFNLGDKFSLNSGRLGIIVEMLPKYHCKIQIENTEYYQKCSLHRLKNGKVKDKYSPSVYGKGFVGEGKYNVSVNGVHTKEYSIWAGILERLFCPISLKKRPTYEQVSICEDWLNFQIFAEWYTSLPQHQFNIEYRWEIDKDLCKYFTRSKGHYSKETCFLLPSIINTSMLITNRDGCPYPLGVQPFNDKFRGECPSINGRLKSRVFKDPESAAKWVLINKKKYFTELANKFKYCLDPRCYEMLMSIDIWP